MTRFPRATASVLWTFALCALRADSARGQAAVPPPPRDIAEAQAAIARAPKTEAPARPLRILLIANRKDHGPHEHDYPRWMDRWQRLLAGGAPVNMYGPPGTAASPGAPKVTVETVQDWPSPEQLARADAVAAYMGTGGIWNEAKLRDLNDLLERGAGFVALHSAVIAEIPHAQRLAELLGLAWESGFTLFRHGPLELTLAGPPNPIIAGLPSPIRFTDETYWPLVGEASGVTVLGTAEEQARDSGGVRPFPMFWTHTRGKGRVFCSILGHYDWTFDDPLFRLLILRGMAWAAGESPYRFDSLALVGARTAPKTVKSPPEPPVSPIPPNPSDPELLLWLDASDSPSVERSPDGGVSAWRNRAGDGARKLVTEGARKPLYIEQGPEGGPAVRFDGADDVLRDSAFGRELGAWTVALVVTPRSNAGGFRALLAANRAGQNDYQSGFNIDLGPASTPAFSALNVEGIKEGGALNLRTASAPFGARRLIVITTSEQGTRLWIDGAEEGGRGGNSAPAAIQELRLGARFYLGEERGFFHGDISEVLLYASALSDSMREAITSHLLRKYGIERRSGPAIALDPWDYLPAFDWGSPRRPLAPIDEAVARARRESRAARAMESRLSAYLSDSATAPGAVDYICRLLARIGTAASVPALEALASKAPFTSIACFALGSISDSAAEAALLRSVSRSRGPAQIAALSALGRHAGPAAVGAITPLLQAADASVVASAAAALGRIGDSGALPALTRALSEAPEPARGLVADSMLRVADRLREEGRRDQALAIYDAVARSAAPQPLRMAAIRSAILAHGAAGVPALLDHLRSDDPQRQAMAIACIRDMPDAAAIRAIAPRLGGLPPDRRARLIQTLAERGDPHALPAIRRELGSRDAGARQAAVKALGRLGDAADVPALLEVAAGEDADLAAAAMRSLATLRGEGVDSRLMQMAESSGLSLAVAAARALGQRAYAPAAPMLIRIARSGAPALRLTALQALQDTAEVREVEPLIQLVLDAGDADIRGAAESALVAVYERTGAREAWEQALLAALPIARGDSRAGVLRVFSRRGGPRALDAVTRAAADPDPALRDAAVRILCEWESVDAADALLRVASESEDAVHRRLALRAYIRLAGEADAPRRVAMCREALRLSSQDAERRLVLAVLSEAVTVDALTLVVSLLQQDSLKDEAAAAAIALGRRLLATHRKAVSEAMKEVIARQPAPALLQQAQEIAAKAAGPPE